jgi:hypothetical protein
MNKLGSIPERALELASSVGDNLKHAVPAAGRWLETGAKLGVLKSGAKVAGTFVRRNPVIAVAAVAGAGLLWYAAHRRAKRAANGEGEAIEGSAKRIDARRAKGNGSHKRTTRKRDNAGSTAQ